jgi:hypothetical protein
MDLGNVRNMIQLSDEDLHDSTSLFSRQDLREYNFQGSIIKDLILGKCFKLVLKEIQGLGGMITSQKSLFLHYLVKKIRC